jgi:hypothetical protein
MIEIRTRDFDAVCIKRFFQIIARRLKVLACRNVVFDSNFPPISLSRACLGKIRVFFQYRMGDFYTSAI